MNLNDRLLLIRLLGLRVLWVPARQAPLHACQICGSLVPVMDWRNPNPGIVEHDLRHFFQIPRRVWDQVNAAVALGSTLDFVRREILGFDSPGAALDFFRTGRVLE